MSPAAEKATADALEGDLSGGVGDVVNEEGVAKHILKVAGRIETEVVTGEVKTNGVK